MKRIISMASIALLSSVIHISFASDRYFLCGPDEDGCFLSDPASCLCMPYDDGLENTPYCMNFNDLTCKPMAEVHQCSQGEVVKNQSDCLATLFQSEAEPACPTVSKSFCEIHHVGLCKKDSDPYSCNHSLHVKPMQKATR